MKNLLALKAKLKKLNDEARELSEKAELTSDDSEMLSLLDEEATKLEEEIKATEKAEEVLSKQRERIKARQEYLDSPADELESPIKEREEFAKTSGLKNNQAEEDPKGGFKDFNEFSKCVKSSCANGIRPDSRLLELNAAYGNNEGAGSEGGFLVPPEYSNKMIERAEEVLPVISKCDKLTIKGNSVKVLGMADDDKSDSTKQFGGVVAYWVGEAKQITRSNLNFRQIGLDLHKLGAISYVTEEMLEDVLNFGERLLKKHGAAIGYKLAESIFFGTGAGQPLGAFVGTSPRVQVAKEDTQDADTIVSENIYGMEEALYPGSIGKADWYYNPFCHKQLRTLSLAVGTGGAPVNIFDGKSNTLDGIPAYRTDHCKKLGDAGDIVLADFSHYLLAMKGGINTAMSIHLRFDYGEVAFKSTFRVDGRPAWDKNLKPANGNTNDRMSPFVKLAERA